MLSNLLGSILDYMLSYFLENFSRLLDMFYVLRSVYTYILMYIGPSGVWFIYFLPPGSWNSPRLFLDLVKQITCDVFWRCFWLNLRMFHDHGAWSVESLVNLSSVSVLTFIYLFGDVRLNDFYISFTNVEMINFEFSLSLLTCLVQ